jgi:hypothetical protein
VQDRNAALAQNGFSKFALGAAMEGKNPANWCQTLCRITAAAGDLWGRLRGSMLAGFITRFWQLGALLFLTVAILAASAYLITGFFDSSPKPVKLKIARTCSPDASPPVVLVGLPANGVVIYPHGDADEVGTASSGTCSAVAICMPRGTLQYGSFFQTEGSFQAHPESNEEMCWAFATSPDNLPVGADKKVFRVLDKNDLRVFQFSSPEASFEKRISFSRWAINLLVTPIQPVPSTLPLLTNSSRDVTNVQIVVWMSRERTIVTSAPSATKVARQLLPIGDKKRLEDVKMYAFADTAPLMPYLDNSLYLVYESEEYGAVGEFLLFVSAAFLGSVLPMIPTAWTYCSRKRRKSLASPERDVRKSDVSG